MTSLVGSFRSFKDSSKKRPSQQESRLWLNMDEYWEALSPVNLDDLQVSTCSFGNISHELKAAKAVVKSKPTVALIPLVMTLLLIAAGTIGVLTAAESSKDSDRKDEREQILASNLQVRTTDSVTIEMQNGLVQALEQVATPLRMIELYAQENPIYPYMEENFPTIAQEVMRVAALPEPGYTLGLAPFGRVADKYPFGNNSGAIGHDNLDHCQEISEAKAAVAKPVPCAASCSGLVSNMSNCYPSRQVITMLSVTTRNLTLDGPITLVQTGQSAFIMRHPIFINTNLTERENPWKLDPHNETFGRGYGPTNCTTQCFNAIDGLRYWGMSDSLLLFSRWLSLARTEELSQTHRIAYTIFDPVKSKFLANSTNSSVSEVGVLERDVVVYNRVLKLRTSPMDGWLFGGEGKLRDTSEADGDYPSWGVPLLVLMLIALIYMGSLIFFVLVSKRQHQQLLRTMLPRKTLPYIERGLNFCEQFPTVTILFSDIVSYTNMAAAMSPLEVVNVVNELFFQFDNLVTKHNIYKVETIGDAFMCAGGVPNASGAVESAGAVADMAFDMIMVTRYFVTSTGMKLRIRVGINSGPVVAAVVGLKMPHYTLFGDTVNTASRMESNSEAMRIHISASTYQLLVNHPTTQYDMLARGELEVKGKGIMLTYWLESSGPFQKPRKSRASTSSHVSNRSDDDTSGRGPLTPSRLSVSMSPLNGNENEKAAEAV